MNVFWEAVASISSQEAKTESLKDAEDNGGGAEVEELQSQAGHIVW